jgi:8-hydroxy-5-deazaflavin:NADPH oxidoreductase
MHTQITIVIIGLGNVGRSIAKALSRSKYRVLLFDATCSKARELAETLKDAQPLFEVEATDCPSNASWEADIIIPAVLYDAQCEVAEKIRVFANQKVVVSLTSPFEETIDVKSGCDACDELQHLLPHSKVVKAFHADFAAWIENYKPGDAAEDCFIAGNDPEAVETVADMVKAMGMNPTIVRKDPRI